MSCEHEHHHHDGDNHEEHDHSHDSTQVSGSSLYGSGRGIIKKFWFERLSDDPVLESDADEQIILHIPFTASCKLHTLQIRTSDSNQAPHKLKLYRNFTNFSFSNADSKPTQEIDLPRSNEIMEIPFNRVHWNTTTSIDLFFEDNHSGGEEDVTHIFYLALNGDSTPINRAAMKIIYESSANPADHKRVPRSLKTKEAPPTKKEDKLQSESERQAGPVSF